MKVQGGIRAAFLTAGIEEAVDAFLADCRQVLLTSDPMTDVTHPQFVQAMLSLAVQRMLHWSALHRDEAPDADMIPTQALIGVFTGLGISLRMFEYDPEEVLHQGLPAMATAWCDACSMIQSEGSDAQPVN